MWSRPLHASLFTLMALLIANGAVAQRLPDGVVPVHYDLTFAPDLAAAKFTGEERIRVQLARPSSSVVLNAAEITFGEVTVTAGGSTQRATVTLDEAKQQATFTVPSADSRRRSGDRHQLHRHPQQRSARPVSQQRQQPPLRGDAARGDGRAARVPVLRRAGASRRRSRSRRSIDTRRHGDLERQRGVRHAGPGAGKHTIKFATDAEDVDLSGGDGGRRFRVHRGRRRRHAGPHLRDAGQEAADRTRARVDAADPQVSTTATTRSNIRSRSSTSSPSRISRPARWRTRPPSSIARRSARRRHRVGRHAQDHRQRARARNGAPVVRRSGDDAVVGRHLAERRIRDLDADASR